jgi:hypothetical protein
MDAIRRWSGSETTKRQAEVGSDFWNDYKNGTTLMKLASHPAFESLRKHSKLDTVGWNLNVPDVYARRRVIKE